MIDAWPAYTHRFVCGELIWINNGYTLYTLEGTASGYHNSKCVTPIGIYLGCADVQRTTYMYVLIESTVYMTWPSAIAKMSDHSYATQERLMRK